MALGLPIRTMQLVSGTKAIQMNIQKMRIEKGWSQEELATHSGLSVRTIQRIENGKRASLESLKCLAAVFETSVNDLVQEAPMTETQSSDQYFLEQAEKEAIEYVQNRKGFHLNWISFAIIMPLHMGQSSKHHCKHMFGHLTYVCED